MLSQTFVSPIIASKLQIQIDQLVKNQNLLLIKKCNPDLYINYIDCTENYTLEQLQIHLLENTDLNFSVGKLVLKAHHYDYQIVFYFDMNSFLAPHKHPFLETSDNSDIVAHYFVELKYDVPKKPYTEKEVSLCNLYNMIGYCYSLDEKAVLTTIKRSTALHLDMCYQINKEFFTIDND